MANEMEPRIPREPEEVELQDAAELPDREAMSLLTPFPGEPGLMPVHEPKPIVIDDPKTEI